MNKTITSRSAASAVTVLLVDDDPVGRTLVRAILEAGGFAVREASDGSRALELFPQVVPQLVLLDLDMPGLDGFSVCTALRSRPDGRNVPIIITTGMDDVASINRAFEIGATDFITKPINPALLLPRLRYLLRASRAMSDLRLSEERLRQVLENMPVMLAAQDDEGRLLAWNRECERVTGYSADDVVGNPECLKQLYPDPSYRERMFHELQQRGNDFRDWEWTLQGRDGQPKTVSWSNISESFPVPGWARWAVGVDISEREKAREILRQERNFVAAVVDTAPLLVMVLDWSGRILRFNHACETLSGYDAEEVVGRTYHETLPRPQDQPRAREEFQRMLVGTFPLIRERVWRTKDGSERLISWHITTIRNPDGQPEFIVANGIDITERRAAELALAANEKKYRRLSQQFGALLDGIPDALFLLSPEMKIEWANRGAATNLGVTVEELAGQYCHQAWHGNDRPCDGCVVRKSFVSGRTETGKKSTGDHRSWGVKAFPLKDESGQVRQVIQLASDITESIRLREEAIRASHLASLGEMAAGVAHEINNPNGLFLLNLPLLNEIFREALPLLERQASTENAPKLAGLSLARAGEVVPRLLGDMHNGATRIKNIVEDLRNFSPHNDPGQQELFALNEVVSAALRLLNNTIRKATNRLRVELGEDLPQTRGNFQRIEQVVINLVQNACQALPDKSRELAIRTFVQPAEGMVVLEVCDEGIGIEEQYLEHITDPFFTTRRNEGGTGLGLSISARIVAEHQGTLQIRSRPGEGTCVSVLLPPGEEE